METTAGQRPPRRIVGFHRDEEDHWVAELECGHTQHVRHQPPWINRPWVVSRDGRAKMLGQPLPCKRCLDEAVDAQDKTDPKGERQ